MIAGQKLRLLMCLVGIIVVATYPGPDASLAFFLLIALSSIATSFSITAMFIAQVSHASSSVLVLCVM